MRSSKTSDATPDQPVPRHARGRTGRRRQHARRLSPRPRRIFRNFSARSGQGFAGAETQTLRDYLADLDARGFKSSSVARRLSAMRHLFRFLLNERIRSDDPAAILSGPEARPRPAEGAVDRRRRSPAGARQGADRSAGSLCAAAASRDAAVLPARSALRHRLAGIGTGGAAALGGAARRPHDRGARQGQQGAAGAAERAVAAGDGRLSRGDGGAQAGEARKTPQARNGCFPRSARAAI